MSIHKRRRGQSQFAPHLAAEARPPPPRSKWIFSHQRIALAFFFGLILVVLMSIGGRFLWKSSEKSSEEGVIPKGSPLSVYDRGLVTINPSYKDILAASNRPWRNLTHRHLPTSVLGYVTPWNGNGYEMAKKYRAKFTHISPVWYQLKRGHKDLELIGGHDVDTDWIKDVRQEGQPLIVPRVVLEGWPLDNMLVETREKLQAIQLISSECRKRGYDGIVFEAWSLWSAYGTLQNSKLRQKALNFVQELGSSLHNIVLPRQTRNMQLIFVIPPVSRQAQELRDFTAADMAYLKDAVDAYSLMTYDFSNSYNPGPNAPLSWMRTCIQSVISLIGGNDNPIADNVLKLEPVSNQARHQGSLGRKMDNNMSKILVGINFYGNDFVLPQGGGPILGHEYLSLLSSYKPKLSWDGFNDEHYFDYTVAQELHRVFYPSLKSLSLRLEEAKSCGAGVSIWEIGQGLEYFFDLL